MMVNYVQLNYDELNAIIKQLNNEGEDITRLTSQTRQRVQELHKEWIGEGADAFFEEMENSLLPGMSRVAGALFNADDVLTQITKTIRQTDEENANLFKGEDDFGASGFQSALGGVQGGAGGPDDFGAGKFGEAAPPQDQSAATWNSPYAKTGDFTEGIDMPNKKEQAAAEAAAATATPQTTGAGGGGGGGGGSSQGLQGDLRNMGVGLADETHQTSSVGSTTAPDLPDHLFGGGGSGGSGGTPPAPAPSGGSGSGAPASGDSGGAAAGVAGVVGSAAVGGAAKVIKEAKEQDE